MAEKKEMRIDNIKKLSEILKDGKIDEFIKSTNAFEIEIKALSRLWKKNLKFWLLKKRLRKS